VLTAASPGVTVIDLSHHIPAFDVRSGAHALVRSVPYLGPGVVLAVVDPGVGSARRGICLEVGSGDRDGPRFFVGPDNGLLVAAAELAGGGAIARGVELAPGPGPAPAPSTSITFDGRDQFAPAAAALCRGVPLVQLGSPLDPATLERLPAPIVAYGRSADGRHTLQAEIIWVDRFGNLQLAATPDHDGGQPARPTGTVALRDAGASGSAAAAAAAAAPHTLRCVETFADLAPSELGLLLDANGHLAVVAGQASAARKLALETGAVVELTW
jgi:hypothetical protein